MTFEEVKKAADKLGKVLIEHFGVKKALDILCDLIKEHKKQQEFDFGDDEE